MEKEKYTKKNGLAFRKATMEVLEGMSLTDLDRFVQQSRKTDIKEGTFVHDIVKRVNAGAYTTEAMVVTRGFVSEVLLARMREISATRKTLAA